MLKTIKIVEEDQLQEINRGSQSIKGKNNIREKGKDRNKDKDRDQDRKNIKIDLGQEKKTEKKKVKSTRPKNQIESKENNKNIKEEGDRIHLQNLHNDPNLNSRQIEVKDSTERRIKRIIRTKVEL